MDIEKITTQVRPRSSWQAVDLGFKMAYLWFWPLLSGYIIVSLPVVIISNLIFSDWPIFALFTVWWLKPVWERLQLVYASHALFGQKLTLKQQLIKYLPALNARIWQTLTFRRLSAQRAYHAPLIQLEDNTNSQYYLRQSLFKRNNFKAAANLTLILYFIEKFTAMALFILIFFLIPQQVEHLFFPLGDIFNITILTNVLTYISYALVAPFYVCSGFSLYLNQRTQIEGWDIEVNFRQIASRVQAEQQNTFSAPLRSITKATKSGLLIMLLVGLTGNCPPLMAAANDQENNQENSQPAMYLKTPQQQKAYQQISQIKQLETFNQTFSYYWPKFMTEDDEKETTNPNPNLIDYQWFEKLMYYIAISIEWILTIIVLILAVLFATKHRKWLAQLLSQYKKSSPTAGPLQIFGLDLPDKNTLKEIPQQALELLKCNKPREALSLLYRGSLQHFVSDQHIQVHESFTEGECLSQVKQNTSQAISEYFARLTQNWQLLAYADIVPHNERLTALIEQWSSLFIQPPSDKKASDEQ